VCRIRRAFLTTTPSSACASDTSPSFTCKGRRAVSRQTQRHEGPSLQSHCRKGLRAKVSRHSHTSCHGARGRVVSHTRKEQENRFSTVCAKEAWLSTSSRSGTAPSLSRISNISSRFLSVSCFSVSSRSCGQIQLCCCQWWTTCELFGWAVDTDCFSCHTAHRRCSAIMVIALAGHCMPMALMAAPGALRGG
jgi:RNase P/RNase MRP subunit p29